MRAALRGTEIYFDIEGMGLAPEGNAMRERPVGFLIHGGPGGDHSGFKPAFTPLSARMQLVYFDHRGNGRAAIRRCTRSTRTWRTWRRCGVIWGWGRS
jgi:proline iminopeptidase